MIFPTYKDLKETYPLNDDIQDFILKTNKNILDIFKKKQKKLIVVLGPCSIHSEVEAIEYAKKLSSIQKDLKNIFLIMRVYLEKPRSKNDWKGFLYDPDLNGKNDILKGLIQGRKLIINILKLNIPIAYEFLDTNLASYFDDLVSFGFIGARTVSSPIHRQLASSMKIPIGFKNPLNGDILEAINAANFSKTPQTFLKLNKDSKITKVETEGNVLSHIVLRGSKNKINFDEKSINTFLDNLKKDNLKILIDSSHGNSNNTYLDQIKCINYIIDNNYLNKYPLFGVMLESYLKSGKQALSDKLEYGTSITDSCISIDQTKELLYSIDNKIQFNSSIESINSNQINAN